LQLAAFWFHRRSQVTDFGALANPILRAVVALSEHERHNCYSTQTAKALGLERSHLSKKCRQLGIDLQNMPERE
jgi:DNA-binding NtrC family response regulator